MNVEFHLVGTSFTSLQPESDTSFSVAFTKLHTLDMFMGNRKSSFPCCHCAEPPYYYM